MSSKCFGKVITSGPGRSTAAQGMVPSRPAPAVIAVPRTDEADRRKAASSARRYWLFGRTDANAEVILYVEARSRQIQRTLVPNLLSSAGLLNHVVSTQQ